MQVKHLLLGAALTCASQAFADGNITGKAVNKASGEPIDFASVQLLTSAGKPLTIGTDTDADGNFTLKSVKDGKYIIRISSVGSVNQERPVTVAGKNVNVGVLKLADDTKVLQEVVVEGVSSQMRFELDKKVFQVDANIAAAGQSASELLESIPSVEVDQDGEVSLRGDSSVTVWINGKESGLTADNRAQILEQIPAETIESIEVITNPSAKYSPEGTTGIINIILKKDRRGGYFGSAEIGGNSRGGGNVGVNFNYNSSKWETFASVGFRMRHNKNDNLNYRTYDNGDFLNSDGTRRNHGNNIFVRAGATYHITDNDAVYANAFGMFGRRWGNNITNYLSNIPGQWSSNLNLNREHNNMTAVHAEAGYKHEWNKNHSLDMVVSYNHWGGPMWRGIEETHTFDDPGINPDDTYQEQLTKMNTNSVEAKVDYTNQLTSWLKLESGFQGNYSHENSPVTTYDKAPDETLAINEKLFNRFIYNNNISALYVTLGGKVKDFSFSAGLRGEAWQVRTKSLMYGEERNDVDWMKINKFALFPSVFLSYSLPMDNEIQVNYTRRIRRPWGGQLNSFIDISDPANVRYGNPALQPQYTNSFELNYIKSWTMHMISVSAYLRQSSDVMSRISYLDNNVAYSTWDNATQETNSGVEIVAKDNLFKCLDLTTTLNLYNNHIAAWSKDFTSPEGRTYRVSGEKRNSFAWDVRLMASVKLPWSMSLQATGRYASEMLTAQGTRQGGWSVDAGIRKSFGDWTVSLNCRDIFNSRKFKNTTYGDGYTIYSEHTHGGRRLQLTIKYSFGNMKAKPSRQQQQMNSEPIDNSGYGEMEM